MKESIRIIIVDDHAMFRDGLVAMLGSSPKDTPKNSTTIEIVGSAGSGEEALSILKTENADLVITDLSMPEMDGLELTKRLNESYPDMSILVLTMHNDIDSIKCLLDAGAAGYLLKSSGKDEFIQAVNAIMQTGKYFSEEVKDTLVDSMMRKKRDVKPTTVKLTEREAEVLSHIAHELTNAEISEKLFISLHTVETHRRNIMRKLEVHNGVGLLRQAIQLGLVDE